MIFITSATRFKFDDKVKYAEGNNFKIKKLL